MSRNLKKGREPGMWRSEARSCQAERAVSAKARGRSVLGMYRDQQGGWRERMARVVGEKSNVGMVSSCRPFRHA